MKYCSLFVAACFALIGTVYSQMKTQGRPVRVLYFDAPTNAPTDALLYSGEKLVADTQLPRKRFSDSFYIPKGNIRLSFFASEPENIERVISRAPYVDIPETWQKVLLLVFENKANEVMPIRVLPINGSDDQFAAGSIYIFNFSDVAIYGAIGDKKLTLNPKSQKIVQDPISSKGTYPVLLKALVKGEKEPRRFIRQMWVYDKRIRDVLFILPKPAPIHATYFCAPIRDL